MRLSALTVTTIVALLNGYFWFANNQPSAPQESAYPVKSLSYNPYQRDQSPLDNDTPDIDDMDRDLELLSGKTRSIRVYNAGVGMDLLPSIAKRHRLSVIASAWLSNDPVRNAAEVEEAINIAASNHNVTRLIIGNETQLTYMLPKSELIEHLSKARKRLRTPVSTAEPWDYWLRHPDLAEHVDFIAIHILPYWNEVPIEKAVDYVFDKYKAVQQAFPFKPVVIAETGWPGDGPQRGAAEASKSNQAFFIREFIRRAEEANLIYNIIEAFDQPWKSVLEGRAGEHWGLLDANRKEKFSLSGPILEDPLWRYWALSSATIGLLAMALFLFRRRELSVGGQIFSALILQLAATGATQFAREAAGEYMSAGDIVFWTLMLSGQALLAIIFLTDAAEIADVVGQTPLKRTFPPSETEPDSDAPFVSLHLACCKEPPEMVIATIDSLAQLDYPNFEVIVVDNNTPDPALWRPVEDHCLKLGSRFRFYSLGAYPGFKAGALNYALTVTDTRASVVGVIDADYIVNSNWLRATVPYFADAKVALVQAPQEHRGWEEDRFQTMENDEYSGFFRIGMVQRNEENAIIQHGTMTLVRKEDLLRVNGWAEWCICEDAELGLRLLAEGRSSIYVNHPLGRGLVPDSYEAYAKQRFRWAYGGMRIMRRHWKVLFGLRSGLTAPQRYHFVKGWLPWIGDALHLLFSVAALVWSAMLLIDPLQTEFPEPIFIYPALALVALRLCGTAWTYATRVQIGGSRTMMAMIAGGSLTHSIAKAVFQGLFISGKPFHRTPKMDNVPALLRSIVIAREEIILGLSLWGSAAALLYVFGTVNDDAILWSFALITQSLPYVAAVVAATISSLGRKRSHLPIKTESIPTLGTELPAEA